MSLGRYDEAIAMFERASELDPLATVPLFNRWIIHMQLQHRPRAAEAVAREAVSRWSENSGFHSMLGWSLMGQGRFSESIPEYRAALEFVPDHTYALPNLAFALLATGEADEAVGLFQRVLDLTESKVFSGDRSSAVRDLAIALMDAGRQGEADRLVLEESKRMRSGSRGASLATADYLALAQLAAAVGRDDEARRWIRKADTFDDPDLGYEMAAALALIGEEDRAVAELRSILDAGFEDFYLPLAAPPFRDLLDEPEFLALFGVEAIS
jgi:tetratricopeptide (TPR) repeat protein